MADKGICEHLVRVAIIVDIPLIGLETKNKLTVRSARLQKCAKKIDLSVSDDEEFNNALNDIEKTLPVNPPSKNPVIDDVMDIGIDEEFLDSIQDPGLHYSNPPHRPVGIPKSCLAFSPPKTKVKAKAQQESQRISTRAKKVTIKYGNNIGYQ